MGALDNILHDIRVAKLQEAIEKRAGPFWQSFVQSLARENIGKQVGEGLLAAGTAAAVTGLGVAASKGVDLLREKIEKPRAFKGMMDATPGLAKQDPKSVQMTFNTLYGMNRQMARDPLVAGSFVSRNVSRAEMGDGAGAYVDPQTAKMLMDAGPRGPGPIMESWKGGPGQAKLYDKIPPVIREKSASADKVSLFREQLERAKRK